MIINIKSTI